MNDLKHIAGKLDTKHEKKMNMFDIVQLPNIKTAKQKSLTNA